jgi:predicted transcriptional regulator
VGQEVPCPEGTIRDGGVKDVHGGLRECALCGVIDAERDRKGKREVHHLVRDPILEVEGVGAGYVG